MAEEVTTPSGLKGIEDNLKRVVAETGRICRERNATMDPSLAGYVACLIEAVRGWGPEYTLQDKLEPTVLAELANMVACYLLGDDPFAPTAELQVGMELVFKQQRELVMREQAEQAEQQEALCRGIISPKPLASNTMDAYEKFYDRVVEYVARRAGMEGAVNGDEAALAEVRAALGSVFPLSGLARYLTLTSEEKEEQVNDLTRIVLGICLYNQHIGVGGKALPPGPSGYVPQASKLLKEVDHTITDLRSEVDAVHRAAKQAPSGEEAGERLRGELVFRSQALVLYEELREDLQGGLETARQLEQELQRLLVQASTVIGSSTSVARDSVTPLFDAAGSTHGALAGELRLSVARHRIAEALGGMVQRLMPSSKRRKAHKGHTHGSAADVQHIVQDLSGQLSYVPPSSGHIPEPLTLNGFCIATLAQNSGLLARADQGLGAIRMEGEGVFGFSSADAMAAFVQDPGKMLDGLDTLLMQRPVLVQLLGKRSGYPLADVTSVVQLLSVPMRCDFGTQTPTHLVERHVDVDYEWNCWALRRRALALANLRQKATHGTQTNLSTFRRDNDSQVWLPKEAVVQTPSNKGQTMPKKLRYIAGLRGTPETKMKVVSLELDIGQPHQF